MTKTQQIAALATLARYIESRIKEIPAGVTTKPLDDQLAMVQRAKEGQPDALLAAKALWDGIVARPEGRDALRACFRAA